MEVVAHRGFADEAPENTVLAAERAAELADAVELDVRRCATGEPVVVHDETVDRVTGATGRVADLSLAELQGLNVLGSEACVPSLAELVAALPPETDLFVELKEAGLAADVLEILADHRGRVLLMAFDPGVLEEVRAVDETVPLGYVCNRLRDRPVPTALELDCSALVAHWRLAFAPRVVASARDAGLSVYAWTVRRRTVARALAYRGVDGVIVDGRDPLGWV